MPCAAQATYPGQNGRIAFSARIGPDTNHEIYSVTSGGGVLTRLTAAAGDDAEPNWNRDGTKLAFTSRRDNPDPEADCEPGICDTAIYTMNSDGSDQALLVDAPGVEERGPAWSPDGSRIAYWREEVVALPEPTTTSTLWIVNADGTNPHPFYPDDGRMGMDPTWRPQGGWIGYTEFDLGWSGVTRSVDGATTFNVGGEELNWSPYNDWVIGTTDTEIFRRRATGSEHQSLVSGPGLRSPVWSPDGEQIAFVQGDDCWSRRRTALRRRSCWLRTARSRASTGSRSRP